ncbi:hypothetical protein STCU_06095 [Strigomonas culicis]|uniref:Uncharacterized protein n=1 Tax=Strigomonas culicis TaxID=28005 RepID=S9VI43_9TRYP|nr:hypothetical protein STCU_06095 [Strigomonas culicis]|eukprot:EPY26756.1 hypothetical protein STCU_06095 [Strigomonas culicis]
MRSSAHTLAAACDDVAAACSHSQMRDALRCMSKGLRQLAVPCPRWRGGDPFAPSPAPPRRHDNGVGAPAREQVPVPNSRGRYHYEDLLAALSSADQTAVCLNAHNNALLVELAAAKDYQRKLEEELHVARTSLHSKEAESQQTEIVLQDQIRALSQEMALHR